MKRRFMAKGKDIRILVILECTCCVRKGVNKESPGISRYITQKNRHNTPNRLEFRKILSLLSKVYDSWWKERNRWNGMRGINKQGISKPWINPNNLFVNPSDLFVGVYPQLDRGIESIIET
ncbi:hypothetical protein IEQ34_024189 [Dendrobium chrysotoxum]|uniref:50S ribosomal protein L33, chloroplastic n=1 Tax=Dendrobium chrysotoxum TaxID=161865 RepID=A0AAV7FSQ1_DENCH|nr:hypothetical protein IEQ34_024189 [Dendrobium chrysotoxum]